MRFVIHPPVDAARLAKIRAAAPSLEIVNAQSSGDVPAAMPEADGFFGKLTPEFLAASTRLRWVQSPTASLEHYVFPELIEHPCTLTNMRGLFSDVIADQVFGYILCFARNIHTYIRQQMEARWAPVGGEQRRSSFTQGPSHVSAIDLTHLHLSDETVGIVGFGEIGSEIGRRALAFGMRVLAVDPMPKTPPEGVTLWKMERLGALLAASRFVVVAAPHTPETEGMFQRAQFQAMRRDAFFINIGRGAIVSLDALDAALATGEIAGAALDVYETEPLPPEHPLWKRPNAILTPHIAGYSPRIAERHLAVLIENVRRFAAGEPLINVVNKRMWF